MAREAAPAPVAGAGTAPTSAEENKRLVRRGTEEIINAGNLQLVDEMFAPDYIERDGSAVRNREEFKEFFGMMRRAFPNLHFSIDQELAEGEYVMQRITFRGTHQGSFNGIPPTGKRVEISGIDLFRVVDGKVAQHWGQFDSLGMLQQLGVVPLPGTSPLGILRLVLTNIGRGIKAQVRARRA